MIKKENYINKSIKEVSIEYDKFDLNPKVKKSEELLNCKECVKTYNFDRKRGTLKDGLGVKEFAVVKDGVSYNLLPQMEGEFTEIKNIWTVKWLDSQLKNVHDYVFCLANDDKIYYSELGYPDFNFSLDHTFLAEPQVVKIKHNNKEKFLFSSEEEVLLLAGSGEQILENAPKILDACFHFDKLFAITRGVRNALVFSEDDDILNWTDSNITKINFCDERGRLLRILNFNDNLYIFREFGITKIDAYSVNSNFGIDHMYLSTSYIFPDTIKVCGGKIYFITTDGLYSFNGNSVEKEELEIIDKIDKSLTSQIVTESFLEKYYIACNLYFDDDKIGCENDTFTNNCILIYDTNTKNVEIIRGLDVKKFAPINSVNTTRLCAIFRGNYKAKIGEFISGVKFFGVPLQKVWQSPFTDGGYSSKMKHIRNVYLRAKENCNVVIETDLEKKEYAITGSDKVQRVKTDVKGNKFSLTIKSSSDEQEISDVKLNMAVYL